jgi:tetratricopeptide (TPR) repeat protein
MSQPAMAAKNQEAQAKTKASADTPRGEHEPKFSEKEREEMAQEMAKASQKLYAKHYVHGSDDINKSQLERYYKEGAKLGQAGKIEQAQDAFTKAITAAATKEEQALYKTKEMANYKQSRNFVSRASCYLEKGNFELAAKDINESIKLCPDYSLPYLLRSKLNGRRHNDSQAREDLATASHFDYVPAFLKKDIEAMHAMMTTTSSLVSKKLKEAKANFANDTFKDGIKGMGKSVSRKAIGKALTMIDSENFKAARAQCDIALGALNNNEEKALFKSSKNIDVYRSNALENRAFCSLMLKDYKEAIPDLSQAIKLNPDSKQNYINRGKAYQLLGKKKEADADFAKAKTL